MTSPPDPKSEKKSRKSTNKKFWPKSVTCNMTSTCNSSESTRPTDFTRNYERTDGIFVNCM